MTTDKKAAPAGTSATPKTSKNAGNPTLKARVKAAIFALGLWGVIPARLASWLIQRGGLRHD